jgi:hypothetical protein
VTDIRNDPEAERALVAAIAEGMDLVIDYPDEPGGEATYYAAEIFVLRDGVGWCQAGWNTTPGHPHHRLKGPILPTDSTWAWDVGEATVRRLAQGEPATDARNAWAAYKAGHLAAGTFDDRDNAWKVWKSTFNASDALRVY